MEATRDSSVLFALGELRQIEAARCEEELELARRRRREAREGQRAEEARRAREAEQARTIRRLEEQLAQGRGEREQLLVRLRDAEAAERCARARLDREQREASTWRATPSTAPSRPRGHGWWALAVIASALAAFAAGHRGENTVVRVEQVPAAVDESDSDPAPSAAPVGPTPARTLAPDPAPTPVTVKPAKRTPPLPKAPPHHSASTSNTTSIEVDDCIGQGPLCGLAD